MSKDIFIARKAGALFVLRSVVYKVVYKKSYDNSGATPQGWVCALDIPTATISIIIYTLEQTFYQTNTVTNLDMIQRKKQIMADLINIPQLTA